MKKTICILAAVLALLAILAIPIPTGTYKDGGTREYTALTYKLVHWKRLTEDGRFEAVRVYPFPQNFSTLEALWEQESAKRERSFLAVVVALDDTMAQVALLEEGKQSRQQIMFPIRDLEDIDAQSGSIVEVTYVGAIMETYPAQINAVRWRIAKDLRQLAYTEPWVDKGTAQAYDHQLFRDIVITKIYQNCFFARTVVPMPYEIKLNGSLDADWCVGDQILVTYENLYYDEKTGRVEADLLEVEVSDFELDPNACYKPVIYLYPQRETQIHVKLALDGQLTCTYPAYGQGWHVTAAPDGTLTDAAGQTYSYLYWEGQTHAQFDLSSGFCVKGEHTAVFLEDALAKLGLTRREANEFIVYWLPLMQENPYNIISFQTDRYTQAAKLTVDPAPDTVIRVFMAWRPSEQRVSIAPQVLSAPERKGVTLVEWGGTELTPDK